MLQQRVVVVIILPNLPPDCQYEVAKNGQARTGLLMSFADPNVFGQHPICKPAS